MQLLRPGQHAVQTDAEWIGRIYERAVGNGSEEDDRIAWQRIGRRTASKDATAHAHDEEEKFTWSELGARWRAGSKGSKFETWRAIRDAVRKVTGGWWLGPRMEPELRILRRQGPTWGHGLWADGLDGLDGVVIDVV